MLIDEQPPHVTVYDGDLGGCGQGEIGDPLTFVPALWEFLIETYGVQSVLDLGCGLGYSTRWFQDHGMRTLGIEGSAEIAGKSGLDCIRVHDFTVGPIEHLETFDLCWTSEFLEHVEQEFEDNIFSALKRCRTVAVTAAIPGFQGHHHVNCQPITYWIERFAIHGFWYDKTITEFCRSYTMESHRGSYFASHGMIFHQHA